MLMGVKQSGTEGFGRTDPMETAREGRFWSCLLRIFWTLAGVALFGGLLFVFLALAVLAMGSYGLLTETSPLEKGLLLIALIFALLLLLFRLFKAHAENFVRWLDDWFRNLDWCVNRGRWAISRRERWLWLCGHSAKPTVFAVLLLVFLVLASRIPPPVQGVVSYALIIAGVAGILAANRWWRPTRFQFVPHLVVLAVVSIAAFLPFVPDAAGERVVDGGLVRHALIPGFWGFSAALILAAFLGPLLFRKYAGRVAATTGGKSAPPDSGETDTGAGPRSAGTPERARTGCVLPIDLPGRHGALGIDWKRFGRSLVKAPVFHLVEILYWPSIALVFVANPEHAGRTAFFLAAAAWVVYSLSEMHEELDNFLRMLRRALFRGPQLLVSVAIIALAAGRMLDNSYIRTLVEGEVFLFGLLNNLTLAGYLASVYLFSWYFGYWFNRVVSEPILAIFDGSATAQTPTRPIPMRYLEDAEPRNGTLEIHESERYALLGADEASSGARVKRILGRTQLINEGISNDCQVDISVRKPDAPPVYLEGREFKLVLLHRLRFYFTVLYLGLVVAFAYGASSLYSQPQRAELAAELPPPDQPGLFNLQEQLFAGDKRQGRPPILLAASGGGTRAALYTYSVLGGLHDIGVLKNVVLASGVSGGSAAIAYFAMHREELLGAGPRGRPESMGATACLNDAGECRGWARFGAVMSAPFIQDALRGLTEWRMAWGCQDRGGRSREGIRLGVQLQESFDRWFSGEFESGQVFQDGCAAPPPWSGTSGPVTRLGDQTEMGLIFNTALAGSFDRALFQCPDGQTCDGATLADVEYLANQAHEGYRTSAQGKGGRLILTNLKVDRDEQDGREGPFPDEADDLDAAPRDYLTYKVVNAPAIPLVSAAALSANFPPVFPNAAVDVDGQFRYWVTDGGATDNRGIISVLYALEGAIRDELACQGKAEDPSDLSSGGWSGDTPLQQSSTCFDSDGRSYPPIHIVMAEASATDPTYTQDRGITTTFGAAERFASQLLVDKTRQLAKMYEGLGGQGIYLHKLAMPLTLRSAGGIGTHWMLPANVTLREPAGLPSGQEEVLAATGIHWPASENPVERFLRFTDPGVDMSGEQAKRLVEALHWYPWSDEAAAQRCISAGAAADCEASDIGKVWQRWICNDPQQPPYVAGWQCLTRALGAENSAAAQDPRTGCPAIPSESCEATRVTWR